MARSVRYCSKEQYWWQALAQYSLPFLRLDHVFLIGQYWVVDMVSVELTELRPQLPLAVT